MTLAIWQATVVDDAGNILPAAQIEVRHETAGSPIATIYQDRDGLIPLGNPFNANAAPFDSDGFVYFYVAGGAYKITATSGSFSRTRRYVPIGLSQESDDLTTGIRYIFSSDTDDSDPTDYYLKFNNSSLASVTQIYISNINLNDADLTNFLESFDDSGNASNRGYLKIESSDGNGFLLARVTGTITNDASPVTYSKIPVTVLASAGSINADQTCSFIFSQRGGGLDAPVQYNEIQDVQTDRVLGRKTAGTGIVEECTIDDILAFAGSPSQGDLLSYDGSNYVPRGGMVLLASGTISAAATLDLVLSSYATAYSGFLILTDLLPVNNGDALWLRFSTDGGSSYDAGASDYAYASSWFGSGSTGFDQSAGAAQLLLNGNSSNTVSMTSRTLLYDVEQVTNQRALYDSQGKNSSALVAHNIGGGVNLNGQDTDAVRFLYSTGNISSGRYSLYGLG